MSGRACMVSFPEVNVCMDEAVKKGSRNFFAISIAKLASIHYNNNQFH